ncbi:hypothetical protein ANI01nite_10460 [Glutamicibacter nicotianae]|uniref:Uncharacterized protein n=1 Tax=Glutamicibacter nicotianae TaxID=37929 RepID=A0ABQ0RJ53_GLUNI|nr:hypothetical protein ANI01nite_10460 [Glutamicibacter nicotianae]
MLNPTLDRKQQRLGAAPWVQMGNSLAAERIEPALPILAPDLDNVEVAQIGNCLALGELACFTGRRAVVGCDTGINTASFHSPSAIEQN